MAIHMIVPTARRFKNGNHSIMFKLPNNNDVDKIKGILEQLDIDDALSAGRRPEVEEFVKQIQQWAREQAEYRARAKAGKQLAAEKYKSGVHDVTNDMGKLSKAEKLREMLRQSLEKSNLEMGKGDDIHVSEKDVMNEAGLMADMLGINPAEMNDEQLSRLFSLAYDNATKADVSLGRKLPAASTLSYLAGTGKFKFKPRTFGVQFTPGEGSNEHIFQVPYDKMGVFRELLPKITGQNIDDTDFDVTIGDDVNVSGDSVIKKLDNDYEKVTSKAKKDLVKAVKKKIDFFKKNKLLEDTAIANAVSKLGLSDTDVDSIDMQSVKKYFPSIATSYENAMKAAQDQYTYDKSKLNVDELSRKRSAAKERAISNAWASGMRSGNFDSEDLNQYFSVGKDTLGNERAPVVATSRNLNDPTTKMSPEEYKKYLAEQTEEAWSKPTTRSESDTPNVKKATVRVHKKQDKPVAADVVATEVTPAVAGDEQEQNVRLDKLANIIGDRKY